MHKPMHGVGSEHRLAGVTAAAPMAPPAVDYCCYYHLLVIAYRAPYHAAVPPTATPWPGCDVVPTENIHKHTHKLLIRNVKRY